MADKKSASNAENKTAKKAQAKKPNRVAKYFKDLKSEFKKVVWPTFPQTAKNTALVLAVLIASAVVVALLDLGFSKGLVGLAGLV